MSVSWIQLIPCVPDPTVPPKPSLTSIRQSRKRAAARPTIATDHKARSQDDRTL